MGMVKYVCVYGGDLISCRKVRQGSIGRVG